MQEDLRADGWAAFLMKAGITVAWLGLLMLWFSSLEPPANWQEAVIDGSLCAIGTMWFLLGFCYHQYQLRQSAMRIL